MQLRQIFLTEAETFISFSQISIKNQSTKSCGCFKIKNLDRGNGNNHGGWKGYETLSMTFFNRIKGSAQLRGIEFNVTIEYLFDLYKTQNGLCAYSGEKIDLPINVRQLRGENNDG